MKKKRRTKNAPFVLFFKSKIKLHTGMSLESFIYMGGKEEGEKEREREREREKKK